MIWRSVLESIMRVNGGQGTGEVGLGKRIQIFKICYECGM